jgi:hypothetical protein
MVKRRSQKRNKKGGFAKRIASIVYQRKVKTFCCEKKESDWAVGTTKTNRGENCEPSITGQCDVAMGKTYKFRCFDTKVKKDGNGNEIVGRELINEKDNDENCKYVAGVAGKVVSSMGNIIYMNGGKKSKRRRSNKQRRTNKRK